MHSINAPGLNRVFALQTGGCIHVNFEYAFRTDHAALWQSKSKCMRCRWQDGAFAAASLLYNACALPAVRRTRAESASLQLWRSHDFTGELCNVNLSGPE